MPRIFTFNPDHNPGRSQAWSVRAEAIRLADQGASGLAGIILRDGFSPLPACAVAFTKNTDKVDLSALCAEILAGLASRTTESGSVKPILNGTPLELFRRRLADLATIRAAGIVVDGRRRTIATIMAYGVGLDAADMNGVEVEEGAEMAMRANIAQELAQRLDPWAKVEAGERVIAAAPSITEVEVLRLLGVKRGDGQLIHRAATAIRKHGLTPDRSGKCPSKEEWKQICDELTREGAVALLAKYQTEVRAKALGVDMVIKALEAMPEDATGNLRALAVALADRATLDAYLLDAAK